MRQVFAVTTTAFFCVLTGVLSAGEPTTRPAVAKPAATTKPILRTIFAAPFENESGEDQYDPAAAGMSDLIAVMLAQQEHIAVVERQRLAALTAEQARSLRGLTGKKYAVAAGKLLKADTVLIGRLFLVEGKLTMSVQALDIASARVVAADQIACRPIYLAEASLQMARQLGKQMSLPLPKIDLKKIDKSPIASLHFAKALSHYYAGNMDAAIMQFMRTVDLDPDYIEAHYWCGHCYLRQGEEAHAIVEWEKLLKRDPQFEQADMLKKHLARLKERQKNSTAKRLIPTSQPTTEKKTDTSPKKGKDK